LWKIFSISDSFDDIRFEREDFLWRGV